MSLHPPIDQAVHYPSSDGKPLADNTIQLKWIVSLYSNLRWWFRNQQVFVAADLLWYPVQGKPAITKAPDVMVAIGRPDGDRPSYKQWEEEEVAPQVVIEVLSGSNHPLEMIDKQQWYARYGVEEFIIIDPEKQRFVPMVRKDDHLVQPDFPQGQWQSPRLGIWFKVIDGQIKVFFPDEAPFTSLTESQIELERSRLENETMRQQLDAERQRAEAAEAELERLRRQLGKND